MGDKKFEYQYRGSVATILNMLILTVVYEILSVNMIIVICTDQPLKTLIQNEFKQKSNSE